MKPLLPRKVYLKKQIRYFLVSLLIMAVALMIGIVGYHTFAGYNWLDALLNASMLMGGMGQVGELNSSSGKLFASFYAIFSGVIYISTAAIMLAPLIHRMLHKLHLE